MVAGLYFPRKDFFRPSLDPRSLDAQRTLARYVAAFTATYASAAAEYKADRYDVDGELVGLPFLEHLLQEALQTF